MDSTFLAEVNSSQPAEKAGTEKHNVNSVLGGPRSIRELIDIASGRGLRFQYPEEDAGFADSRPFPFLAIVGQREMKLALLLTLINPAVGGVLLIGPRGSGKTTAARSLVDLLPQVSRSLCRYGCMPEDIQMGGIDAVCPDCARKFAEGESLLKMDNVHLIELPLNSRLEDVVGWVDEKAASSDRFRIHRGLLAQADQNLLYIDEVNLLDDTIADVILDAAAQSRYSVRRGPIAATYRARFSLIGSMNPEEGILRPQIMDRFGLRVFVRGLNQADEHIEAYHRVHAYKTSPQRTVAQYVLETELLRNEIQSARDLLLQVNLPDEISQKGFTIIDALQIESLRATITFFEAARAHAAADNRLDVQEIDLREVAPLALRSRRSEFITEYFSNQKKEEAEIFSAVRRILGNEG